MASKIEMKPSRAYSSGGSYCETVLPPSSELRSRKIEKIILYVLLVFSFIILIMTLYSSIFLSNESKNLATKTEIDNIEKKLSKIRDLATKTEINSIEKKLSRIEKNTTTTKENYNLGNSCNVDKKCVDVIGFLYRSIFSSGSSDNSTNPNPTNISLTNLTTTPTSK